jgi:hypothetical protein
VQAVVAFGVLVATPLALVTATAALWISLRVLD